MILIVNSPEEIYPSPEALGEVGITYATMEDGKVAIELDDNAFRVAENKDMTRLAPEDASYDASLTTFVVAGHRIYASGSIERINEHTLTCNGPFRVFSKIKVTTFDYMGAIEMDISEWDDLNRRMLEASNKQTLEMK